MPEALTPRLPASMELYSIFTFSCDAIGDTRVLISKRRFQEASLRGGSFWSRLLEPAIGAGSQIPLLEPLGAALLFGEKCYVKMLG